MARAVDRAADERLTMRILHVETRHRRGGAERNVLHTALWEASHGHEVHLAVGSSSLVDDLPRQLTVHLVPTLVRAVSPANDLRAYLDLRRLIRDGRFDLVHTHQSKAGVLGRIAARGIAPRIVHTIHMASFGPAYSPIGSRAFLFAERVCARTTDVIVAVGTELEEMYLGAHVGRRAQYVVIRSPIDVDGFVALRSLTSADHATIRERHGLPLGVPLVLVAASLEPRKRVDLVIRELSPLLSDGAAELVIAGDGPERPRLESLVHELGIERRAHIAGHVDNVGEFFAIAAVLVHAATVEGVPQVVIQALAAGIPVIATEMTGIHEIDSDVVRVVPASRLSSGVAEAIAHPPSPIADDRLSAWRPPCVDEAIAALHRRLEADDSRPAS